MSETRVELGPYKRRDDFIAWACNVLLRFASPRYRAMIGGSISYGLKAAASEVWEERPRA